MTRIVKEEIVMPTNILVEGKTKIVLQDPENKGSVLIQNKPDVTAEDGERRDVIKDKDILVTTATCNIFRLLARHGIRTHFLEQLNENTFRARELPMLPIECVARRRATGSFLKRSPKTIEGTIFDEPVIEFFFKDDTNKDPLMLWDNGVFTLFKPKVPFPSPPIGTLAAGEILFGYPFEFTEEILKQLEDMTSIVFLVLEEAWRKLDVTLVDFKIEFGVDLDTGRVVLADVIDGDNMRLWPGGNKAKSVDKDGYRNHEDLTDTKKKYAWVAEATKRFSD